MTDPARLVDDAATPEALRADLAHARDAAVPYDLAAGLARLGAATARPAVGKAGVALGVALVLGAGGLAAWLSTRDAPAPVTAPVPVTAPAPRGELAPVAEPEPAAVPAPVVTPAPVPTAPPAPARAPVCTDADEIERTARAIALTATDPAGALRALDETTRACGASLREEREAYAVDALARLGRAAEARRRGERFLAGHPDHTQAPRVRRALTSLEAP